MEISISLNTKPITIDKSMLVSIENESLSGVYVMRDARGICLYVGKTSNLRNRMTGHRRDSDFYRDVEYIEFYPMSNEYKKDILETHLINEFRPIHNVAKTYYMQEDYEIMLEEIDAEIGELENEIRYLEYYLHTSKSDQYPCLSVLEDEDFLDDYDYDVHLFEMKGEEEELAVMKQRLRKLQNRKRTVTLRKSG